MTLSSSIHNLPIFSKLVKDYLAGNEKTKKLFSFEPSIDGLLKSIKSKEKNYSQRVVLSKIIDFNYADTTNLSSVEIENLNLLKGNGYAVTTAHQPNLFLGPLYTITKAISTISLANQLNIKLEEKKIVPIFVIGSEDHDKEELLHSYLFHKKYEWITEQNGAIGSMHIDDSFIELRDEWTASFGNLEFAEELKLIYTKSYIKGNTVAESFGNLLKSLFGKHGLIVLDINIPEVKQVMIPVFEKELRANFAVNTIQENLNYLENEFSIQAPPRNINLFEYRDGERKRIDEVDEKLIARLHSNPEKFSPNVILRPLMQQIILPSIANIGGGAEVAYWLQLKPIFGIENIDFPAIILRDIYSPLDAKSYSKWAESKLDVSDFFLGVDDLNKKLILQDSTLESDFKSIENKLILEFESLENIISTIDKSLVGSYEMELTKLRKSIELLYGKSIKAEKRKSEELLSSIEKIKNKVFENNGLVERRENFSSYYLRYGSKWIDQLISNANPLAGEWKLIIT